DLAGEADEGELVFVEKLPDFRDAQMVLVHVEQEIAALAGAEEIRVLRHGLEWRAVLQSQKSLAAFADVSLSVAVLNDERAERLDVTARQCAVEPYMHESARPQQRKQHPPALRPILKVMQHPNRFDEMEHTPERAELENIGLCIFDVAEAELACLAERVAKAGATEVDREDARVREPPRDLG